MPRSPILHDGLWRCLCPTVDLHSLRAAVSSPSGRVRPVAKPTIRRQPTAGKGSLHQRRRYETAAREEWVAPKDPKGDKPKSKPWSAHSPRPWMETLLTTIPPSEKTLSSISTDYIVKVLRFLRAPDDRFHQKQRPDPHERILFLVKYLLRQRDYPLNPFIYECVMDAMAFPNGSVDSIRRLFHDLADQGKRPTTAVCQSALRALAVHPDYALRRQVLDMMADFWFPVDQTAKQSVVLGMLREQQYELAYLRLTEMAKEGIRVELWVYDIFIMVFGGMGFLDEMLSLLYLRKDADEEHEIVPNLMYYALDVCSQAYHHSGTTFVWLSAVRTSILRPSDGILENVLGTASRHGDTELATEVLGMLSSRGRARDHHYEATADAFAEDGNISGALRTLCIMKRSGYTVEREGTVAICQALRRRPELINDAETALRQMYRENEIPAAAVGAVVEAKAEAQGSEATMELYHDISLLSGEKPSVAMIESMIAHSASTETRQELIRSYVETVKDADEPARTPGMYDALIPAFTTAGEAEVAFRLASQAVAARDPGLERAPAWIKPLVGSAVEREDGRVWTLMDEFDKRGDEASVRQMGLMLRLAKAKQPVS